MRFAGEGGGGSRAAWATLSLGEGGTVRDDHVLVLEPGRREVPFVAVSDPDAHSAPATMSAVDLEFKAVRVAD